MGDIPLDRGGLFKFGNFENRKGAAKPRPLCTPLGLFLSSARDSLFLFVDLCLYASVFSALRCADVVLFLLFLCGSLLARCLYASILSALRCADVVLFLLFLCGSLLARCLYASILSAPCYADVLLFLHFLCGSLLAKYLYSSILSALRCADVLLFLHFLYGSLLAKCPYASMFNMLRCADIFHFFTFSMIHFWQGVCILRYSVRYALRSLALNLRRGEAGCWW